MELQGCADFASVVRSVIVLREPLSLQVTWEGQPLESGNYSGEDRVLTICLACSIVIDHGYVYINEQF